MRVPAKVFAAIFLLVGILPGCASRRIARDHVPQEQKFWNGCEETTPANPDGFRHFTCTDFRKKQWEVLVRKGD